MRWMQIVVSGDWDFLTNRKGAKSAKEEKRRKSKISQHLGVSKLRIAYPTNTGSADIRCQSF